MDNLSQGAFIGSADAYQASNIYGYDHAARQAAAAYQRAIQLNRENVSPSLIFTVQERGFTLRESGGGLGMALLSKCWAFSTIEEVVQWLSQRHSVEGE